MSTTNNGSATSTPASAPAARPTGHWSGPDPEALRNLIVNYLPPLMNEMQLCQLFGQFGPIESVKIIYDKVTHESRGYGFVKFQFFFSASYAISCLNRYEIAGKTLKVAYANAEAAKEAFEGMKLTTTSFSPMQQAALQAVYCAQVDAAEMEANTQNGWR